MRSHHPNQDNNGNVIRADFEGHRRMLAITGAAPKLGQFAVRHFHIHQTSSAAISGPTEVGYIGVSASHEAFRSPLHLIISPDFDQPIPLPLNQRPPLEHHGEA
jgi:hypothetical protein